MEKDLVENLIIQALQETSQLVINGVSKSHIIMPYYRAKIDDEISIRYSEQELKQVFLSLVREQPDLFYSVETPSKFVYSFSNDELVI